MSVDPQAVRRFADDLGALLPTGKRLGLAVSGGPDSLALLLLAASARPGKIEAATVDHGLRDGSAGEAMMVAGLCDRLGVAHRTLKIEWDELPTSNIQARARNQRYRLLAEWARDADLAAVATAHHIDDQAETLLMRLARGSGIGGLAGVRADMRRDDGLRLIRPLLGWRKDELVALCRAAAVDPADDPSNRDLRYDRARVRRWMADAGLDGERLAASADALGDAEQALQWAMTPVLAKRLFADKSGVSVDPNGLPREIIRRLLLAAFAHMGAAEPRGADLMRAIAALQQGQKACLSGLLITPGQRWHIAPEPPRRS